MKKSVKVRLYAGQKLIPGSLWIPETAQAHYLLTVLRLNIGDKLKVFDGCSGEYLAEISEASKKNCVITILEKLRDMAYSPDLWLLFAPVKKDKTDFIIAGATELGVRKIMPVITQRTISERIKKERFEAQAIEAAEQCRRLDIPEISSSLPLENVLKNWPENRILYFMDESGHGECASMAFGRAHPLPAAAILVGPEGGFSEEELQRLRALPFAKGVSLGKRILRAETAVMAALSCWQAQSGDWNPNYSEHVEGEKL